MHIPPELFHDIALFCTPKTVIHLQHSCTVLRKLLQNKRIWKHLVSLHFQTTFTEAINQSSTFNILALYFAGYPLDQQEQGIVPMSHAARMGEHRIVQLLLRLGAGDQMNFDQSTALMDTIENGYFDTARTMLQLGHSPNRESNLGITPFQIAAKNGLGGLCYDMIDRHLDIHFRNVQRRTHLHEAARFGLAGVCRHLISLGADPNAQDERDNCPLHEALRLGTEDGYHYVTCRILIDAGALIDVPNTWGITPLMLAVRQNNLKVIQLLIDSGADINFTTAGGLNALFASVYDSRIAAARILLQNGISLDHQNQMGKTVMHEALLMGSFKLARFMLQYKPNLQLTDYLGDSVIANAIQVDFRYWEELCQCEVDWNVKTSTGFTLLHIAAGHTDPDAALWWTLKLLEAGVDPTIKSQEGALALDLCLEHRTVAQLLSAWTCRPDEA